MLKYTRNLLTCIIETVKMMGKINNLEDTNLG